MIDLGNRDFKTAEVKDGKRCWYKVWLPAGFTEWQVDLCLFLLAKHGSEIQPGGTGYKSGEVKLFFWKRFVQKMWPEPVFFWDEWAELFFATLCGAADTVEQLTGQKPDETRKWWRQVVFWGAASTGKSAKAAIWILGNWLAEKQYTTALLTSTSRDKLADRIWADLVLWIGKSQCSLKQQLEIINSELEVRWNPADRKGMISGEAVKSGGSVDEAVDRLKGMHNRRMFAVIDEMTAVPKAIIVACRNLNKGTQEFQLIGMANPREKTDPCGERSEPRGGWGSIDVETSIFWETEFGCVVRFDGLRNPGLKDKRLYFYPTQEQLDEDAREAGGVNSPEYMSGVRGFIAVSRVDFTVMDDALLEQFETQKPAIFKGRFTMCGFFDPAFEGGDRRVLYPAKKGTFADGKEGLEYLPPIIVGIDASTDVRWIHYAIADAVQAHCENYLLAGQKIPILPENFMMDTSGEGGGLFSIMSGRWSDKIKSCEFGGGAEKVQISPDRPVTYFERYGNRVTAMWYRFRRYIEGGQIKGLQDPSTRKELTSRNKLTKAGKTHVEPKIKMKERGLRSPDLADAAVIGAEFMFVSGVAAAGSTGGGSTIDIEKWNAFAEKSNLESTEGDYQDEFAGYQ